MLRLARLPMSADRLGAHTPRTRAAARITLRWASTRILRSVGLLTIASLACGALAFAQSTALAAAGECPAPGSASGIQYLCDDFVDSSSTVWVSNINGGAVKPVDGAVSLTGPDGAGGFPYMYPEVDPIPVNGDVTVTIRMRFDSLAGSGTGADLVTALAPNQTDPGTAVAVIAGFVHADTGAGVVFGAGDCRTSGPTDVAFHTYEWRYQGAGVQMLLDGVPVSCTPSAVTRPNTLYFGNPVSAGGPWTAMSVSSVSVVGASSTTMQLHVGPAFGTESTTFHTSISSPPLSQFPANRCPDGTAPSVRLRHMTSGAVLNRQQVRRIGAADYMLGVRGVVQFELVCTGAVVSTARVTVVIPEYSYVALGDSFASGEGLPVDVSAGSYEAGTNFRDPTRKNTLAGCHRAKTGWARQIGARFSSSYPTMKFAACSGARIPELYAINRTYAAEIEWPQNLYLSRSTRLVTLSDGGNDVGFADILAACVWSPDRKIAKGTKGCSKPGTAIRNKTEKAMGKLSTGGFPTFEGKKTLSQVYLDLAHRIAPGATIVVAGYPRLLGNNEGAYRDNPIANKLGPGPNECQVGTAGGLDPLFISWDDAQWIRGLSDTGDETIKTQIDAARAVLAREGATTKIEFADVRADIAFGQHAQCDFESAFINGVQVDTSRLTKLQSSFHPNQDGQNAYVPVVAAALRQ